MPCTAIKRITTQKALDFPQNYEFAIAFAVGHKNTEKEPHEFDFDNSVSFI